jgi:hypothetical protein
MPDTKKKLVAVFTPKEHPLRVTINGANGGLLGEIYLKRTTKNSEGKSVPMMLNKRDSGQFVEGLVAGRVLSADILLKLLLNSNEVELTFVEEDAAT